MRHEIELLKEKGYYILGEGEDLKKQLNDLKNLGYDCFYNSNHDAIVWKGFDFEKFYNKGKAKQEKVKNNGRTLKLIKNFFIEYFKDLKWCFRLVCGLTWGMIQLFTIPFMIVAIIYLIKHI